jgi:hypothetical protein
MDELVKLLTIFVYAAIILAAIRLLLLVICYVPEIIDRISFSWTLKKTQNKACSPTGVPAGTTTEPAERESVKELKKKVYVNNGCEKLEKIIKQAAATIDENAVYIAGDFLRPDEPIEITIRIEDAGGTAEIEYLTKILSITQL